MRVVGRRNSIATCVPLLLAVLMALQIAGPLAERASAHPWGPYTYRLEYLPVDENVWYADNATHTYCFSSGVGATVTNRATNAMATLSSTDMYQSFDSNCDAATDVAFQQVSLLTTWRGIYECSALFSTYADRCDHAIVRINLPNLSSGHQVEKTALHEVGHSVGLRHYSPQEGPGTDNTLGCMVSGQVEEGNSTYIEFSSHEKYSHINGRY